MGKRAVKRPRLYRRGNKTASLQAFADQLESDAEEG